MFTGEECAAALRAKQIFGETTIVESCSSTDRPGLKNEPALHALTRSALKTS
jgi:hypothetical protein